MTAVRGLLLSLPPVPPPLCDKSSSALLYCAVSDELIVVVSVCCVCVPLVVLHACSVVVLVPMKISCVLFAVCAMGRKTGAGGPDESLRGCDYGGRRGFRWLPDILVHAGSG